MKYLYIFLLKVLLTNGLDYFCNFETDMCEWKNENDKGLIWSRGQGSTATPYTGPSEDHTKKLGNGWYIYVDVSKNSGTARLLGPDINGTHCLQFWYHMYGADINTLNAILKYKSKEESVFYRKGTQGNRWKEAKITIGDEKSQYQVIFAVKHSNKLYIKGDIALDDIYLKVGQCSFSSGNEDELCTFDDGNDCGFKAENNTNFQWKLIQASKARILWPQTDHSLGTKKGWYWILSGQPSKKNNISSIISPRFTKKQLGQKCIQFYFYIYETSSYATLNVNLINSRKEESKIFSKDVFTKKIWTYTEASFNPDITYQIKFQGTFLDSVNSISIDDVIIHSGSCPESGFCDFEENLCTWSHGEGDLQWLRNKGNAISSEKGPVTDHTKGKKGYYLFINIEDKIPGMIARLESDTFPPMRNIKRCIGFWYNMNGIDVGSLKVYIKIAGISNDLLWELDGHQSQYWQKGIVPLLSEVKEYQVIFEGIVGKGKKGYIALDDIYFTDSNSCVISPLKAHTYNKILSKANCTFDDMTFCQWTTNKNESGNVNNILEWKFGNESSVPQNTGPVQPLGGKGYYIFISTSKTSIKKDTRAIIESPNIKGINQEICFSFYYYMFGAHVGDLKLYLKSINNKRKNIWNKFGTQPDRWHNYQTELLLDENNYTLEFEATPGDGFAGDIALDEIGLTLDPCSKYELCDFESNLCGWNQKETSEDNYYWLRGKNLKNGPKADHTTGSEFGYYLQAKSKTQTAIPGESIANLISPIYDSDLGSHCLTFWYYRGSYGTGNLQVFLQYLDNTNSSSLWSNMKISGSNWNFAQVTIQSYKSYQIIIQATKGISSDSDLAIDDLNLSVRPCTAAGSCNFDYDLCSYTNDYESADFQWLLGIGRIQNYGLIDISLDHIKNKRLFVYADLTNPVIKQGEKARLISEILSSNNQCLEFWYYITGSDFGSFNVKKRTFNTLTDEVTVNDEMIWFKNGTDEKNQNWRTAQISISNSSSKNDYQIIFEIVKGKGPREFVAFDDVVLENKICSISPTISPTTDPTKQDKQNKFFCNFDNGNMCSWKVDKNTLWWQIVKRENPDLPKFDHTQRNFKGRYIYVLGNKNNLDTGRLLSPETPSEWIKACFSFWFYMKTDGSGRLSFRVQYRTNVNKEFTSLWTRNDTFGYANWQYTQITVQRYVKKYKVDFLANVISGVIALDDLNANEGNCPTQKICTFDVDDCGYKQSPDNPLEWRIRNGNNSDVVYRLLDHTTQTLQGNYMYLSLINLTKDMWNKKARLFSPLHSSTEGSCVKFWYHLYNVRKERLNGYIYTSSGYGDPLWSVSSNEGGLWHGAQFSVPSLSTNWQVVFEISWLTRNKGQVALDDIEISDGLCLPPGYCDFEDDLCLWQNILSDIKMSSDKKGNFSKMEYQFMDMLNDNFDWIRHLAEAPFGPSYDHTIGNKEGHFLLLDSRFPHQPRERAILMSERLNTTTSVCFKFWYYIEKSNFQTGSEIRIFRSNNYSDASQIKILNEHTNKSWQFSNVLVTPESDDDSVIKDFWIYLVGVVGTDSYAFAAVDDLEINDGLCEDEAPKLFNCGNKQTILMEKVCNFINDCANGKDEEECGTCDFEKGQCGWHTQCLNTLYCWTRRKNDGDAGAVYDHTKSDGSGYYMLARYNQSTPQNSDMKTELFGSTIHESSSSCLLQFWYSYYGKKKLEIYLNLNNKTKMKIWINSNEKRMTWYKGTAFIGFFYRPFMLSFVSRRTGLQEYAAIDDISFSNCRKPEPSSYCSLDKYFLCDNRVCIDKDNICDYTDDCGDNSDENKCEHYVSRCNFDISFCDWLVDNTSNAKWTLQKGFSKLSKGPSRDHTSNTKHGMFLYTFGERNKDKTARLLGPTFQPTATCQMRLYYDIFGYASKDDIISLRISTKTFQNGNLKTVWNRKTATEGFYFILHPVTFNETSNFQVVIESQLFINNDKTAYIALDDISFTPDCMLETNPLPTQPDIEVTTPPIVICNEREVMCKSNDQCVEKYQVCDFEIQCVDGSDESECGQCDFSENMCGWTNTNDNTYKWKRVQASEFKTNRTTAPIYDSFKNKDGWFAAVAGKNSAVFDIPVSMRTPLLQSTSYECKIEFYYHFNSNGYLCLNVVNSTNKFDSRTFFEINKNQGKEWVKARVPISHFPAGYQFEMIGYLKSSWWFSQVSDIAVDNIKYINCNPRKIYESNLNCTFEEERCSWYKKNFGTDFEWKLGKGYVNVFGDGPKHDHSGKGNYMYIGGSYIYKPYGKAQLISPPQNPSEGRCLILWYYMFGRLIGTLNIIMDTANGNETVWSRTGSQANSWKMAQRTIKNNYNHTIIIEGIMGKDSSQIIAIDDISFWNEPCPHSVECDFELDSCDMHLDGWEIRKGMNNIPSRDHSTNTSSGQYAVLLKNEGNLTSPLYAHKMTDHCLRFWYFLQGTNIDLLKVFKLTFKPKIIIPLWKETGDANHLGEWLYSMITVKMNTSQTQIIFTGIKKANNTIIALDDIKFLEGSCPLPGSCNFEADMCTWQNLPSPFSLGGSWLRKSGSESDSQLKLLIDHTTGSPDGWYLSVVHSDTNRNTVTAVLQSEHLHYSPTVCIHLWYYIGSSLGTKMISISYIDYESGKKELISNITKLTKTWNKHEKVIMNVPEAYKFYILGEKDSFFNPVVAIDDIYINSNCEETTTISPIPTSEPSYWMCDFEDMSECSWIIDDTWRIKQGRTAVFDRKGPTFDNTKKNSYGYYAYFNPSNNSESGDIISALVPSEFGSYCFNMYYYLYSPVKVTLTMYLLQEGQIIGPLIKKENNQINDWQYASFNLNNNVNVSVILRAERSSVGIGDIAVDDLLITEGSCPILKNNLCDFESEDICGFEMESPDYISWMRMNGSTPTAGTGPDSDHTLGTKNGHYMVVQSSKKGRKPFKNSAYLIIPNLPKLENGDSCIQFWYHMYGSDIGELNIYIRSKNGNLGYPLWSRKQNHGNEWRIGQVSITAIYEHDVVFEAVTEYGDKGDIALDDVLVKEGKCLPPGNCDFEYDLCTWQNRKNDINVLWLRNSGPSSINDTGPTVDHTRGDKRGYYIYIKASNPFGKRNLIGILESEYFEFSDDRCLSFWYHMYGNEMGSLQVNISSLSTTTNQINNISLFRREGNQGNKWNPIYLNLKKSKLELDNGYQILFIGTTKGILSDIAIDDISVKSELCSKIPDEKFDCHEGGTNIDIDKVCNFEIDCKISKEDEENCGSCDFEHGFCGWTNKSYNNNYYYYRQTGWNRRNGSLSSIYNYPSIDHTTGLVSGWYAYVIPGTYNAMLISPGNTYSFKRSGSTCKMIFWYYISGCSSGNIKIKKIIGDSESTTWLLQGDQGINWNEGKVFIGRMKKEFRITISASFSYLPCSIAIDDIDFKDCSLPEKVEKCEDGQIRCPKSLACITENVFCDFTDDCGDNYDESEEICNKYSNCTFEEGSLCEWKSKNNGEFSWKIVRSRNYRPYSNSGPLNDHTEQLDLKGHYLLFRSNSYAYSTDKKAWYISPNYIIKKDSICALRFYYYLFGEDFRLNLYSEYEENGWSWELLWQKHRSMGQVWEREEVLITDERPFHFIFEGDISNNSQAEIAIDDISITPGCLSYNQLLPTPLPTERPTAYPCRENQFKCIKGSVICIEKDKVCDLLIDCDDGSDEENCGPCDFEKNMCSWTDESDSPFKWARQKVSDIIGIESDVTDHTNESSINGFVVSLILGNGIFDNKAILQSPDLSSISSHCEIKFWYYRRKQLKYQLSLKSRITRRRYYFVKSEYNLVADKWTEFISRIPENRKTASVQITAQPYSQRNKEKYNNTFFIDDISLLNCNPKVLIADCNFDTDFCFWKHDKKGDFNWKRHNSTTETNFTGPTTDHTTGSGYFILLDQFGIAKNKIARLKSPLLASSSPEGACFSFWYFMYGKHIGTLSISIETSTEIYSIWEKSYNQGKKWLSGEIFINTTEDYNIYIIGKTRRGGQGDIAVDDVKLIDGPCHQTTLCDFEQDFCGWKHKFNNTIEWIRSTGLHPFNGEKPETDHTTNTIKGNFIYMPKSSFGDRSVLMSPYYNNIGESCIELWYNMFGYEIGTLGIYQRTDSEIRLKNKVPIFSKSGDHMHHWRKGQVTLEALTSYYIVIEARQGIGDKGYIAIDDIKLTDDKCSNIGSCNFEKDTCGWSTDTNISEMDWIRRTGLDKNFGDGPVNDHSFSSVQGHYMYAYLTGQEEETNTRLISEDIELKDNYCFNFWYYMFNTKYSSLNIEIYSVGIGWNSVYNISESTNSWKFKEIDITPEKVGDFFIIGLLATVYSTQDNIGRGIAIDDVVLSDYNCNVTTTPTLITFTPAPTFSPSKYDCNFETDFCLWENPKSSLYKWEIKVGHSDIKATLPRTDHTTKSTIGHYAALNHVSKYHQSVAALSTKDAIDIDFNGACIRFWYYIYGSYLRSLKFMLKEIDTNTLITYWSKSVSSGPTWNYQQLHLNNKGSFYLLFEGQATIYSDVALDDIQFNYGSCPPEQLCTVENNRCGYYNSIENDFSWSLGQANLSYPKGPKIDHTYGTELGSYFYISSNEKLKPNMIARLETGIYSPQKNCMRFWYHLMGSDVGILTVFAKFSNSIESLWSEKGDEGDEWHAAQVNIEPIPSEPFKYIFEAKMGKSPMNGTIAIDDIEILENCEHLGDCNFEEDTCLWINDPSVQFEWLRGSGEIFGKGTNIDHTFKSQFGVYLYAYTNNQYKKSSARLLSPFLTSAKSACFSYWFYRTGTLLPILTLTEYSKADNKSQILNHWTLEPGDKWQYGEGKINNTSVLNDKFRLIFEASFVSSAIQFIALDDFALFEENCKPYIPEPPELFCDNKTVRFSTEEMCDFYQHCQDNTDEKLCGTECNFENDLCNWIPESNYVSWKRIEAKSSQTPPFIDHTYLSSDKGYYVTVNSLYNYYYYTNAYFQSPVLKHSSPTCRLTFWYYMTDDSRSFLGVQIKQTAHQKFTEVFNLNGNQNAMWHQGEAVIGRIAGNFTVYFVGKKIIYNGGLAIDDLLFSDCAHPEITCINGNFRCLRGNCISDELLCDYNDDCGDYSDEKFEIANCNDFPARCNFDNSDICDWKLHTENSKFTWKIGPPLYKSYGPNIGRDHTLNSVYGKYIYFYVNGEEGIESQLRSPVMIKSGNECKFRFFYTYGMSFKHLKYDDYQGQGPLTIYTRQDQEGQWNVEWTTSRIFGQYFEKAIIDLSHMDDIFEVIIESVSGTDDGAWIIDDLSFSSGCSQSNKTLPTLKLKPSEEPKPCNKFAEFTCDNSECIGKDLLCDFIPQCKDQSDETRCGTCTFDDDDNPTCGWKDTSLGSYKWIRQNGNQGYGITNDVSKTGYYMYVSRKGSGLISNQAQLQSPTYPIASGSCTIEFYFYITNVLDGDGSLRLSLDHYNTINLWTETRDKGKKWNKMKVYIGSRNGKWNLKFIATHIQSRGDMAIDEVKLINCGIPERSICKKNEFKCNDGGCILNDYKCDFNQDCGDGSDELDCSEYTERCDFENGFCHWTHESLFQWTWFSGRTLSEGTGPNRDHTYGNETGHYLYIPSAPQRIEQTASIASTVFLPTNSQDCQIRLWYHMFGEDISNLTVFVRATGSKKLIQVRTISGQQGDEWKRLSLILSYKLNFQVIIEGKQGKGPRGDIAIDDISFTPTCNPLYKIITTPIPTIRPPGQCTISEFTCEDNSCISKNKVCDFKEDCPYGADERTCPSKCDFEANSLCGWTISSEIPNDVYWNVTTFENNTCLTDEVPSKDYLNFTNSHYLLMCCKMCQDEWNIDAGITSPKFSTSTGNCLLNFWMYSAGNINSFGLKILSLDIKEIIWENANSAISGQWINIIIGIGGRKEPFNLSFARINKYSTVEIFALDDLKFENCSFPKSQQNCPVSQYYCRNSKACIDRDLLCDLSDDCGDGTDENGCEQNFLITFENGTKFFSQDTADDIDWNFGNGIYKNRLKYRTGPPFDHTYFMDKGNYIYITNELSSQNKVARLISNVLYTPSMGVCSLRFYYYMFGDLVRNLTVSTKTSMNNPLKTVWQRKGQQGDYWKRASINLKISSPFQVVIEGRTGERYEDVIAIDDISLRGDCEISTSTLLPDEITSTTVMQPETTTNSNRCLKGEWFCKIDNYCISDQRKCDFSKDCSDGSDEEGCVKSQCTFENGNLCEWKIKYRSKSRNKREINNNIFTWIITRANDTKISGHPLTDHSGNKFGWYAIVDSNLGSKFDITTLETPFISRTHAQCKFQFWYYCDILHCPLIIQTTSEIMDGISTNQLWYPEPAGESLEPATQWRQANTYLSNINKFKIQIQAKKVYKAPLSIDDLVFTNCEPPKALKPNKTKCDIDMFMCNDHNCINESLVCDFSKDCLDGSDESDVICQSYYGRCSFESGICNSWELESGTEINWKIFVHENSGSALLPRFDHTSFGHGRYLTTEKKHPSKFHQKARVASYVIIGTSSNDCLIRFWYYLIGQNNSINVYRRNNYHKDGLEFLSSFKTNKKVWDRGEVAVNIKKQENDFKVVLEGEHDFGTGSVSLDDLSMTRSCYESENELPGEPIGPPTPPNDCSPYKFQCKNGNCYSRLEHCNFIDDCGDGTDEADCGTDCNFEDGTCGWYNPPGYRAQWIIATSSDIKSRVSGPTVDHSFRNESGHFIYPGKGNFGKPTDMAQFHSKVYLKSGSSCTFNFWYHMYHKRSEIIGNLRILIKTSNKQEQILTIWDLYGNQGNKWHQAVAEIGQQSEFSIVIEAIRGNASENKISIDDIKFESCSADHIPVECSSDEWMCKKKSQCIKKWQLCDKSFDCKDKTDELNCEQQTGDCNFDNLNWIETCQWEFWPVKTFNWSQANQSWSEKTGPPYDHNIQTQGYYIYIYASNQSEGDSAAISTPSFPASEGKCHLRYWYFMHGSKSMGKLIVSIYGNKGQIIPIYEIKGPIGKEWKYNHLKIDSSQDYKVVFEAFVGGDMFTDIAIDDVTFTKECQEGGTAIIPTGTPSPCNKATEFICKRITQCISSDWVCDCYIDCQDGSDEEDCDNKCTTIITREQTSTPSIRNVTKFTLSTKTFNPSSTTSSSTISSSSSSTPFTTTTDSGFRPSDICKKNQFECGDKSCIPRIYLCDGYKDCSDGSDEEGLCSKLSCGKKSYFCHDLLCIREELICDGTPLCSDGSDESMCNLNECPSAYCQNNAKCSLNKNGFPVCSCLSSHFGNRCLIKEATKERKSEENKAWIAGVVIGSILLLTMIFLILRFWRNRQINNSPSLRTVDNPVYGMTIDNFTFGELDTQIPGPQDTELKTLGIDNPLYQKY